MQDYFASVMLTTVDERGGLHSRPMSNKRDVEFDGDLWFFTYGSSHKVDEVNRRLKEDGFDVAPPQRLHAWTFYVKAPGGFTVEVLS